MDNLYRVFTYGVLTKSAVSGLLHLSHFRQVDCDDNKEKNNESCLPSQNGEGLPTLLMWLGIVTSATHKFMGSNQLPVNRLTPLALLIVLSCCLALQNQAQAAITYVQQNGSAFNTSGGPTATLNVPITNAPAVGNTIIVAFSGGYNSPSGTLDCRDNFGTVYNVDRSQLLNSGPNSVFLMICSKEIVTGQIPTSITINHHQTYNRTADIHEFSGIATEPAKDQENGGTGSSQFPTSGATPATIQADELVIGTVGVGGPSTAGRAITSRPSCCRCRSKKRDRNSAGKGRLSFELVVGSTDPDT